MNAGGGHRLYVCQSCKRDEQRLPTRGARLDAAVRVVLARASIPEVILIRVACLNGCRNPCNASLRAPRKFGLRLSRLEDRDAPAVVALLAAYLRSPDGDPPADAWPAGLRERLSARVPPPHLLLR